MVSEGTNIKLQDIFKTQATYFSLTILSANNRHCFGKPMFIYFFAGTGSILSKNANCCSQYFI
jgi:hypothetical protein